jgi:cytochrome c556
MVHLRRFMGTLLLVLVVLALPLASVQAQSDEAAIGYRQKVMQANGANMGAIGDILKNKLPHQGNIVQHAYQIQSASQLISSAFKQQVTAGKTDAKEEVWKDWDKFVAAAKELEQESNKLATVAQSGDMTAIDAQVKAVGKACGDCHKPFRKPKEQSYKQQ